MEKVNEILAELTGCADTKISFFIGLQSGALKPDSSRVEFDAKKQLCQVHSLYAGTIEETIYFSWDSSGNSIWHRRIKNVSRKKLHLKESGFILNGIHFGAGCTSARDYFYHVENPRIYDMLTIPVHVKRTPEIAKESEYDEIAGNKWADSSVVSERVGASPYQPFPAVLLSNYESSKGLVHGTLSQEVFYHNYLFSHEKGKVNWTVFSSLKAVAWRRFLPGEVLSDRWYLGTADPEDIGTIFEKYLVQLRRHLPANWGSSGINRHSVVWGSWNDGNSRDIDQTRILKTAEFISKNLPTVEWIQLDEGFGVDRHAGLSLPFDGEKGVDKKKFPRGLKYFTDEVKKTGLKPALWIGGHVDNGSNIAKREKEWFIDYSYRIKTNKVLDVSLPEVRDYMENAIDMLLKDFGFEGVKHDFWSYAFEDSGPFLAKKDRSGYEWRAWWLKEVRRRLPDYGYFQTGCDIVMGNPFLGQYFTNYRYGIDVGIGHWDHLVTNALWGAACLATHSGDLFVPNSDSIGLLLPLPDNEALLWINYCMISRSLVEIAGWLHKHPKHPRQYWIKKAICCPNNGQDVFFADYDYRKTNIPPAIWFFNGPHFSLKQNCSALPLRTVAVFNISDSEKTLHLDEKGLGLPNGDYTATDIWSFKSSSLKDYKTVLIPPRHSIMLSVSGNAGPQIFDSDVKIDRVVPGSGRISLELAYAGKFRITLSQKPKKIAAENSKDVKIAEGAGNWHVEGAMKEKGLITLRF